MSRKYFIEVYGLSFHFYSSFFSFFHWSIVDLQCCVSSRCTAKSFSYIYMYIYICFFFRSFALIGYHLLCCIVSPCWWSILYMCVCMLNHVRLFLIPWTAACQAPLSMEFTRQEYWSRWPFSSPGGIFPTQGSNPRLLCFLHWQADSLPLRRLGSPFYTQ